MSNLSSALQQLRQEHKQAEQQVEKLQSAISVVEGLVGRNGSRASRNRVRPGRVTSVAARWRMALAQKSTVGKSSARVEAVGWENEQFVTCEVHDVGSLPEEKSQRLNGRGGEV
jgi:hypothetical protein